MFFNSQASEDPSSNETNQERTEAELLSNSSSSGNNALQERLARIKRAAHRSRPTSARGNLSSRESTLQSNVSSVENEIPEENPGATDQHDHQSDVDSSSVSGQNVPVLPIHNGNASEEVGLARDLIDRGITPTFEPQSSRTAPPNHNDIEIKDKTKFVMSCKEEMVRCFIVRDKNSFSTKIFPKYYFYMEEGQRFLLAARRRKKNKSSNYLISLSESDLARRGESYFGKVRSNFMGTEFHIYDDGENPQKMEIGQRPRRELASVVFNRNVLGYKGPRKMSVIVPGFNDQGERYDFVDSMDSKTIVERYRVNNLENMISFENKQPVWNKDIGAYVLNFNGRVRQASVKNFQLVQQGQDQNSQGNQVVMQFGKVTDDRFNVDFKKPITPFQAFAISLCSFDHKLACE
eukprot:gb/GECH01006892.1/.p1 GENE.gb/GECH01006892.1/~~gb/GECH01006892.1/.p1  ORF type:complete len:406 (+),score=90.26 gb/GECH01006892.1/:1-1218(+)